VTITFGLLVYDVVKSYKLSVCLLRTRISQLVATCLWQLSSSLPWKTDCITSETVSLFKLVS